MMIMKLDVEARRRGYIIIKGSLWWERRRRRTFGLIPKTKKSKQRMEWSHHLTPFDPKHGCD